jgi:hypothetical protein
MHDPFIHHRKAAQTQNGQNAQKDKKSSVPVPVQDPEWNDIVARVVSMLFYYIWFVGPSSSLETKSRVLATPPSSPQPGQQQPNVELFYATIQNARHFQKFLGNLITSLTLNPTVTLASLYYVCKFREVAMQRPIGIPSPSVKILDLHDHVHQVSFEYRLMCICLMLANKMWGEDGIAERKNDQWSEVSGIPIPELTTLESQMLSPSRGFGFDLCLDRQTYSTWLSRVYHEFVPAIFALPNAFPGSSAGGLYEHEIRGVIEQLAKVGSVSVPMGRGRLCGTPGRRSTAAVAWEDAKKVIKRQWATCIKWNNREESEGFLADATPVPVQPLITKQLSSPLTSTDSTMFRTPVSSPEDDDVRTVFDAASRCSSRTSYKTWDSVEDTPQSSSNLACPKPVDRHKFHLVKTWSSSTLCPDEMQFNY